VLQVNGDNPAIIQVGATYTDLGAQITGPKADLNLGITTYVNGAPMNPIQLDTTQAATDTIAYVATDQSGLASTTTRTVIVEAAPPIAPRPPPQLPPPPPQPNDPAVPVDGSGRFARDKLSTQSGVASPTQSFVPLRAAPP
jgi:hypothetical protein